MWYLRGALADLAKLLEFAERHGTADATLLFPKGVSWEKELGAAQESWSFQHDVINSNTQSGAVVLKIEGLERV